MPDLGHNIFNGYSQAGCLADRLLTGLGQPQINSERKTKKSSVLLRWEIMIKGC